MSMQRTAERKAKAQGFETISDHNDEGVDVVLSKKKGTPVTPESFAQWKETFDAEMAALKKESEKKNKGAQKLTGKQMFESGGDKLLASDGPAKDGEGDIDMSALRKVKGPLPLTTTASLCSIVMF